MTRISPGEHFVTREADVVIVTVLGSCVAACIRDPLAGVGGMNHFMLPESETGHWGGVSASMRYGNFAMEVLINDILRQGGRRSRLEIKVFGGARMISSGARIGHGNADFVEAYLEAEGMAIAARHLRGEHARRIEYRPSSGHVRMLEMVRNDAVIAQTERAFRKTIRQADDEGSVELFG